MSTESPGRIAVEHGRTARLAAAGLPQDASCLGTGNVFEIILRA